MNSKRGYLSILFLVPAAALLAFLYWQNIKGQPEAMPGLQASTTSPPESSGVSPAPPTTEESSQPEHGTQALSTEDIEIGERSDSRIQVIPEFDRLISTDPTIRNAHAQLEREPRDPYWAVEMEEAYRNWVMGNPALARFWTRLAVDCRTSICELRLVALNAGSPPELEKLLYGPSSNPQPKGGLLGIVNGEEQGDKTILLLQFMFRDRGYKWQRVRPQTSETSHEHPN